MKKAIVFTALAFSAATLSAQYNIDLSRVILKYQHVRHAKEYYIKEPVFSGADNLFIGCLKVAVKIEEALCQYFSWLIF